MSSVSYITTSNAGATGAVTSHTYSSISLGDADVNRWIIVTVNWVRQDNGYTLDSATIGGVSATIAIQSGWDGGDEGLVAIIYAKVPSGTTGDIALTFSNNMLGGMIGVYRTVAKTISVHDSASASTDATNPLPLNADTLAGWFAVGAGAFNDSTSPSSSWNGLTQNYGATVGGGLSLFGAGASADFASSSTPLTISFQRSDASNEDAGVVISFTGTEVVGSGPMLHHMQIAGGVV